MPIAATMSTTGLSRMQPPAMMANQNAAERRGCGGGINGESGRAAPAADCCEDGSERSSSLMSSVAQLRGYWSWVQLTPPAGSTLTMLFSLAQ